MRQVEAKKNYISKHINFFIFSSTPVPISIIYLLNVSYMHFQIFVVVNTVDIDTSCS